MVLLHDLPDEVLCNIALCLGSPPKTLASLGSLLLVSARFADLLAPRSNAQLYAALFEQRFDIEAITRRFGQPSASVLTAEFTKRVAALNHFKGQAIRDSRHEMPSMRREDLWLAYLMFLENDGLNVVALRDSLLPTLLRERLLHAYSNLKHIDYPDDSIDQSLVVHLAYLLTTHEDLALASRAENEAYMTSVKPYVMAAHRYGASFVSWRVAHLHLERYQFFAYVFEQSRPSRKQTSDNNLIHLGQKMTLACPFVSHAAIFSFFQRIQFASRRSSLFGFDGGAEDRCTDLGFGGFAPSFSKAYDLDFERLRICHTIQTRKTIPRKALVNGITGRWEGRFAFFDFDAYREMLGDQTECLYESPFGEQGQTWHLRLRDVWMPKDLTDRFLIMNADTLDCLFEAASTWEPVMTDRDDDRSDHVIETLVEGTGLSPWGSFTLIGRVRAWDGLCVIMKDYREEDRGSWLYRGYVTAGSKYVGRWRDTFSPTEQPGYEGDVLFVRRQEQQKLTTVVRLSGPFVMSRVEDKQVLASRALPGHR